MAQFIKGKQIAPQTVILSGDTGNVIVSGDVDLNGNFVIASELPTLDSHLTNKGYVDAVAQGLLPHEPVRVVSTTNITRSGLLTIDGYTLSTNDRVLVAGQTDPRENGIFSAQAGAWVRTTDADGDPDHEVSTGDFVYVRNGTNYASSGWVLTTTDSINKQEINPGVDTQVWFQMAAPGSFTANGEGLKLDGNVFRVDLDGTTLTQSNDGLKLNDTLSTTISDNTTNISTVSTNLSTETSVRSSADTSLSTALSNEISDSASADTSLSTAISTESSLRTSADTSLSTSVSTESSLRTSADTSLESNDTSLSTSVSTESSVRASADTSLSTAISTETSVRASADTSLSTAISTETSVRASADTSLSTAIELLTSPLVYEEVITPSNIGSTNNVITTTTAFLYDGVLQDESVFVFLNGIKYRFTNTATVPGATVFYANVQDGLGTTLYFNGVQAGFAIESDDELILKYTAEA